MHANINICTIEEKDYEILVLGRHADYFHSTYVNKHHNLFHARCLYVPLFNVMQIQVKY